MSSQQKHISAERLAETEHCLLNKFHSTDPNGPTARGRELLTEVKLLREEAARLRAALMKAHYFIESELEVRESSFLPDATDGEDSYIQEAKRALDTVRNALKEGSDAV